MPSVKLALGTYVVLKKRADGTHRALFQVPPRLRPEGWTPAIPLPRYGERTGKLDADEVAAIQRDARQLYAELEAARRNEKKPEARSLKALVRSWQMTQAWADLRPKTKTTYGTYIRNVETWNDAAGDPTTILKADVEQFLRAVPGGPVSKKHTLKILRIVMDQAVALGWRTDNPCQKIRIKIPVSRADVWEQADVDAYVKAARAQGRESIAAMILLMWEIGQRLTDVRLFRVGAEYGPQDGVFRFWQSKTQSYVTVPVSAALRPVLAGIAGSDGLYLFRDEVTGKPYAEDRLGHVFGLIRDHVVENGGRNLLLKWLRHSCVVQLVRREVDIMLIRSITGHAPGSIMKIITTYCPPDSQQAVLAQQKRGII